MTPARALALAIVGLACAVQPATYADSDAAPFTPEFIQDAYTRVTPGLCLLAYSMETRNPATGEMTRRPGFAMGVIVSPDGLVLSHGHLAVGDRSPIGTTVQVGTGDAMKEYPLTMLSKPDDVNLTFFKIETDDDVTFPYVKFDTAELQLGDPVLTWGMLGEPFDHARTFQIRHVGAVLETPRRTYALEDTISFGFVAGPVLNAAGKTVGVIGFDLSRNEGGDVYTRSGHPLIYQADLFQKYIDHPPSEEEEHEFAWLGVFSQPLTDDLATYWSLDKTGGVIISTVVPGSPAEAAGLQPGDVIKKFNGIAMTAKTDQEVTGFTRIVRETPIGSPVKIELLRDGKPTTIDLTLAARPVASREAEQFEDDLLGLTVRELTTDSRLRFNLSDQIQGVLVRGVRSGSPAQLAGIRPNFIVLGFGRRPVRNLNEYRQVIELMRRAKPAEVTLFCRVGANTAFFRLRPRWD